MKFLEKEKRFGMVLTLLLLACSCLVITGARADDSGEDEDAFKPGFSGYVSPIVGIEQSKSLSEVSDDDKRINSLDQDAGSETEISPMLLWKMGYTLENGITRFYAGTPEENIVEGNFLLEAGIRQKIGGTVLTAAWIPNVPLLDSEVWSDPFLLNRDRAETDQDAQAFKLEADSVFGSPVTLRYGYGTLDVDNEQSGAYHASIGAITSDDLSKLNRDSDFHLIQAMYTFSLGQGINIRPQFGYMIGDADGGANSFNRYRGEITVFYPLDKWVFFGNIHGAVYDYDETNPIFGRARKDDEYGFSMGVSYDAPFGWENISLDFLTGYENRDSNIKFYDSRSAMCAVGMSWSF
ncbi:MAG: DUF2860 domain-containing protein [Desulfobacterales bacterium]|nr:DUF2860 domain-containing protein [Desulfobacterales bacterium]